MPPLGSVCFPSFRIRQRATAAGCSRQMHHARTQIEHPRRAGKGISLHRTHAGNRIQFWNCNPCSMQFKQKFLTHPKTRHVLDMVIATVGWRGSTVLPSCKFLSVWLYIVSFCLSEWSSINQYWNLSHITRMRGRDISVGIATRYPLDSPGMESRWERAFPYPPRRT
jgi:hypothetical protein